jgi:plastocyanin
MATQPLSNRTRRLLAGVAAVALAGALLGGLTVAAGAARSAKPPQVQVGDNFYSPTKLTVTAGTKVTWTWIGSNTHNVTVVSGPKKFRSVDQTSGTFSQILKKTGTYQIVCTFHPGMTMTLVVKRAPKGATTTTTSPPPSS